MKMQRNLEEEGEGIEWRRGKPEVRYLALRLRTKSSHWLNLNAGPAVMSPNIYNTCISIFIKFFSLAILKEKRDPFYNLIGDRPGK